MDPLELLKNDHRALLSIVTELEGWLRLAAPGANRSTLPILDDTRRSRTLNRLSSALMSHIEREENLFAALLVRYPDLSEEITTVRDQHLDLVDLVREIQMTQDDSMAVWSDLATAIRSHVEEAEIVLFSTVRERIRVSGDAEELTRAILAIKTAA